MRQLLKPGFSGIVLLMALVLGIVGFAIKAAETRVDQAVRLNFVAAGLLSRIQLEGERMRRFEKEMFIYAAQPANRSKYIGEFRAGSQRLLSLLNEAAAPSSPAFTHDERLELVKWLEATSFYVGHFDRIAAQAEGLNLDAMPTDQKMSLSIRFNADIKEGKDRFATLLTGTAKMREAKEKSSMVIGQEIASVFRTLFYTIAGIAAVAVAVVGWLTVRQQPAKRPAGGSPKLTPQTLR